MRNGFSILSCCRILIPPTVEIDSLAPTALDGQFGDPAFIQPEDGRFIKVFSFTGDQLLEIGEAFPR